MKYGMSVKVTGKWVGEIFSQFAPETALIFAYAKGSAASTDEKENQGTPKSSTFPSRFPVDCLLKHPVIDMYFKNYICPRICYICPRRHPSFSIQHWSFSFGTIPRKKISACLSASSSVCLI